MIRSHTLVENYEYISRLDEAVDSDASDFDQQWKLYRDGAGQPPMKPGVEPTRFKLRHVTSSERAYLLELAHGDERCLLISAAAIALVEVKGLDLPDGKPFKVARDFTDAGLVRITHASKDSLDLLPLEVLIEVGGVVVERMNLRPS